MRLLIVTQTVDQSDPYLGFFHSWLSTLSARYTSIEVVCLSEGEHDLPQNVSVHSLGKERGVRGRTQYAVSFLALAWRLKRSYDAVFVHMNEEYVLLGGLFWLLLGKPVYLWRNHYAGNARTQLAGMLSRKVFYTSADSYTARFKNAVRMPVGVEVGVRNDAARDRGAVVYVGRITPSKRLEVLADAIAILRKGGSPVSADLYGPSLPADIGYRQELATRDGIRVHEGVPHREVSRIMSGFNIFVNCAPSGMFDKAILEAAAAGCLVLAQSSDWQEAVGEEALRVVGKSEQLAARIAELSALDEAERRKLLEAQDRALGAHSLARLAERLGEEICDTSDRATRL